MKAPNGKKRSLLVLLLFFAFFSFLNFNLMPYVCGSGESWFEGWSYRKSHVMEKVVGAGTNYQVRITVDYGNGYDFGDTVYVEEKCQPDFQDIRFTGNDGESELDYWLETYVDSVNATFWVEVADDLSMSDVTIYLYYGNDTVSTKSNGEKTFIFFDDFNGESLDLDKWTVDESDDVGDVVSYSVNSGVLRVTGTQTYQYNEEKYLANYEITRDVAIESRIRTTVTDGMKGMFGIGTIYDSGNRMQFVLRKWDNPSTNSIGFYHLFDGGIRFEGELNPEDIDTEFRVYTDRFTRSLGLSTLDIDRSNIGSKTINGLVGVDCKPYITAVIDTNAWTYEADWFFVRKYVDPEPSHGSWGEEVGNYVPTNLSFNILDMDDTDNLYAQKHYYTAQYVVTDYDGYAEIDYAEFSITQGSTTRATFRFDQDTTTFSIESGSSTWDLDVENCSHVSLGKTITMNFLISPKFNAFEESDIDISGFVVGDDGESATRVLQSDYADVVTNLVVSGFACDDYRGNVEQTLNFSGAIYYSDNPSSSTASSSYPPDIEFTAVHIQDSKGVKHGSCNTISDGKFCVSFSALSSIALEAYNPYIDMADPEYVDTKESPTATFISDRIKVLFNVEDNLVPLNTEAIFNVTLVREYDSSLVSSYSYNINRDGLGFNNPHTTLAFTDISSSEITRIYNITNVMDNTYGLTAFADPNDIIVEWYNKDAQTNFLTITVVAIVIAIATVIGLIIYRKKGKRDG